jgi:hypothetical protein
MDFLSLAQRYDLIGGRLSMKADAMLSGLRERGGKHRIIKRNADEACLLLIYDGQEYESRLTWEEAKREPFIYNGKESEILRFIAADNQKLLAEKMKPKYATPRARTQMLWARAVSDGVRAICPEVNTGTYTPEEIEDFDECSASLPVVVASVGETQPSADAGDVEDAVIVPTAEPEKASGEQMKRIMELFDALGMEPTQHIKAFQSVGATSMADITVAGAAQIIEKMEGRLSQLTPSPPAVSEAAIAVDTSPASEDQIAVIKSLIESVSQREGMAGLPLRIKEHLNKHDISKFAHLSTMSAQSLIDSLNGTTGLDDFFDVPPRSANAG